MMNNTKTLEEMLWVFLPSVAQIVSKKMNISLQKADEIIYNSSIYGKLEDKECKMWYYPDEILADFFINEYERKELYGV